GDGEAEHTSFCGCERKKFLRASFGPTMMGGGDMNMHDPWNPSRDSVQSARDQYLRDNGFSMDAYDAPTVAIPIGPFTIRLPNTQGRKKLVRFHDLHHVATGYGTDLVGEGEIGAWELGAGCTNLAGYVYNGLAMVTGVFLAPHRIAAALRHGRRGVTLYKLELSEDEVTELLAQPVASLRARLGIPGAGLADRPARRHSAAPELS
ncbi:MAG: hypothetical protein ACI9KE_002859, partial [Polyangiales bacterium]